MQYVNTDIHNLVSLIRLSSARQTSHLTLQNAAKNLSNNGTSIETLAPAALQLLEAKARVVASIDYVAEELVSILLAAQPKVLGKKSETAMNLCR